MDHEIDEFNECSDAGYSENDTIETFLNLKSRQTSQENRKISDNLVNSSIKVVELFITSDYKFIARCSSCLYKTEINNVNSLLDNFIRTHTLFCSDNQFNENVLKVCNNFLAKEIAEPDLTHNKHMNQSVQFIENSITNKEHSLEYIENITSADKFNTKNVEKYSEIYNSFIIDDFENSFIYPDTSESNEEILNSDKDSCISIIFDEDNGKEENLISLTKTTTELKEDKTGYIDPLNSDKIQKLDEKFYYQLAHLNPDQSLCQFCNTKFRYISRHYKNHHPEIIICEIEKCFQTFNSLPELNSHHKRFHNDPKFAFTCTICQYKTNNLHYFRFHYKRIHLNIKNFDCNFCEMKFFSNCEKTKHMRSHTGQKPYICEKCNSKYSTKQHLNLHIQKYHSEPQFECSICNKKFHRKQTLKELHMMKHTLHEKKIICEICGNRFILRKHWRDHYNNTHNPDRKRWKCDKCGKCFSRNSNLKDHQHIHA